MREQGRIDKDGHLKNGKDPKKAKKHDQWYDDLVTKKDMMEVVAVLAHAGWDSQL
jgi:hypothetical protein